MSPELRALLKMPTWARMRNRWASLTKEEALFSALLHVRGKSLGEAMQLAEEWESFVKYEKFDEPTKRRLKHQWDITRLLVFCADISTDDNGNNDELDVAISSTLKERPDFIHSNEEATRALIFIRAFRHLPKQRVVVPIAGWDKEEAAKAAIEENDEEAQKKLGDSGGFIAKFVLEAFENGTGQLTHHPTDLFSPLASSLAKMPPGQKDFFTYLGIAWNVANELSQQKNRFYGCWRLLTEDGVPMTYASGASASGAAAWGWYCALTSKVYDPRVIVLAQINAAGVLEGVLGVPAKVKAIATRDCFDTIVVASQENKMEAEKKLQEMGKLGLIRVVNLSDEKSLSQQS